MDAVGCLYLLDMNRTEAGPWMNPRFKSYHTLRSRQESLLLPDSEGVGSSGLVRRPSPREGRRPTRSIQGVVGGSDAVRPLRRPAAAWPRSHGYFQVRAGVEVQARRLPPSPTLRDTQVPRGGTDTGQSAG